MTGGLLALALAALILMAAVYRRRLRRFSQILSSFQKDGTLPRQGMEDTMESKLESQLVSALRRVSLQEERARREKDETARLLSDLSHQLKTPLANIIMNTEILRDKNLGQEERTQFFLRNEEQAQKMQWLMKNLVKASRLEQGVISFECESAPLHETLARSISGVYAQARDREIAIETEEFHPVFPVHNPKWTSEAIGNILENAVKYSPRGGVIRIRVSRLEMYVKIEILDQGPGVPKSEYNSIFQRFYRGRDAQQQEGSGLGLYLAQLIAQREKGYITVGENPEGTGSCFTLFLPLA